MKHRSALGPSGAALSAAIVATVFACSWVPPAGDSSAGGGASSSSRASSSASPASSTSSTGGMAPAAPYDATVFDAVRIGSDGSMPNFQKADADVDLHDGPFASVTLTVDLATTCFPFSGWSADPPPPGQNWPADCDAFDRNFELSFDDPADATGTPGIEVMRAITPFGGPEHQEIDITDVANGLAPGVHKLRVVIPTYSDGAGIVSGSNGGWNVTTTLHATPGAPPHKVLAVIPLWDGEQTDAAGPGTLSFKVPDGTTGGRLEYRATGHGGALGDRLECIGPAEEFCARTFALSVDSTAIANFNLWRTNCADNCTVAHYDGDGQGGSPGFDYCAENPCGDMNSVRASRANWCPGSLTPPLTYDPEALHTPGDHDFSWTINTVASGGEWRISAFYLAFGD